MRRVEIIGAAGVGKTTLLHSLIKNRNSKKQWYTSQEARWKIIKSIYINENSYRKHLIKIKLNIPIIRNYIFDDIRKKEYRNAIWGCNYDWQSFTHACMNYNNDESKESLRILYRYQWLLRKMEEAAFFQRYQSNDYVILDESICQKIWPLIILFSQNNYYPIAEDLFSKVPLPHGIIHIKSEPHIVVERLTKRENVKEDWMLGFRDYNSDALYRKIENSINIINTGVQVMRERGVEVLDICASKSIDVQVNNVNRFIQNLSKIQK